jgi:hypothetical protein
MDEAMSHVIGHRAKCGRPARRGEVGLQGREVHPVQPDRRERGNRLSAINRRDRWSKMRPRPARRLPHFARASDRPAVVSRQTNASGQLSPARHIMTASARARTPSVESVAIGVGWQCRQ